MADTPPPSSPVGPSGGDNSRRKGAAVVVTWRQLLGALIIIVLIGAGIGVGVLLSGSTANAREVALQPTNSAGSHPFMPNVGTDVVVSRSVSSALNTTPTGTNSYTGDSIGLYGGTLSLTSCNRRQMINYLAANPAKAAAWADVEGISVGQIPPYILALTPVILRYDTRVTNHGFVDGRAYAIPEILQAGQAVLVDKYGVLRARCYCGNPLTPAVGALGHYVGAPWPGFTTKEVIVIRPSITVITKMVIIDPRGDFIVRPTGTGGGSDKHLPPKQLPGGVPLMPGLTPSGAQAAGTSTSTTSTTSTTSNSCNSGATGSTGNTGNTGASSTTGNTGASSTTGNTGASSTTGNTGASSTTGNTGARSTTGNTGASSTTGNTGASSTTGNSGASSTTINTGANDTGTGNTGTSTTSTTSNSCNSGTSSSTSSSGTSSNNSGTSSTTGNSGTSSATGNSGITSTTGNSGASGAGNTGTGNTPGNTGSVGIP